MHVFRNGGGTGPSTNSSTSNAKQSSSNSSRQLARSGRARIMRTAAVRNSGTGTQGGSSSTSRGTGVIIGSGSSGRSLVTGKIQFLAIFESKRDSVLQLIQISSSFCTRGIGVTSTSCSARKKSKRNCSWATGTKWFQAIPLMILIWLIINFVNDALQFLLPI